MATKEQIAEAKSRLEGFFEIPFSSQVTPDFLEMNGDMGGDIRCVRYYFKDGTIREM